MIKIYKNSFIYKTVLFCVLASFLLLSIVPFEALAQGVFSLPAPGTAVPLSPGFAPALIKGMRIHPENPLQFDFIIDTGQDEFENTEFSEESTKLIRYFLAALTTPEEDLWVNLSPYESDRIIPDVFGTTEMGRDLLAQDYILKQIAASLTNPETDIGKEFWQKVYKKAYDQYGTTDIPVDTFNKVWIMPQKAVIYEHGTIAFIIESYLQVLSESDYLAMRESALDIANHKDGMSSENTQEISNLSSEILKKVILPEIEKEVNYGKNFATLRQIYHSMILAAWYKQNLKESLLGHVYIGQNKVGGVDIEDKNIAERIYQKYLEAFRVGVYNIIRVEQDPHTQRHIPRKYFSGGMGFQGNKISSSLEIIQAGAAQIVAHSNNNIHGELRQINTLFSPVSGRDRSGRAVVSAINAVLESQIKDAINEFTSGIQRNNDSDNVDRLVHDFEIKIRNLLRQDQSLEYGKALLDLNEIALRYGFILEESPLGFDDERWIVVYGIMETKKQNTPQGIVNVHIVRQITRFQDGLLRGNPGWSSLFNNYVVVFRSYAVKNKLQRIKKAFEDSSSVGPDLRIKQRFDEMLRISRALTRKSAGAKNDAQNVHLEQIAIMYHEVEHEQRRRMLDLKEGDTIYVAIDEKLAELRSMMRLLESNSLSEREKALDVLAHVIELAAGETAESRHSFAWSILEHIAGVTDTIEYLKRTTDTIKYLERIAQGEISLEELLDRVNRAYAKVDQQWRQAYGAKVKDEGGPAQQGRVLDPESQIKHFIAAIQKGKYQQKAIVDLSNSGKEIILVGDLHGRKDNLIKILNTQDNLAKIKRGDAVLVILGDAVHSETDLREMDTSVDIMRFIMDLKIQNPDNVYYVLGNHDYLSNLFTKGNVYQGLEYKKKLIDLFGEAYISYYEDFIKASPLMALGEGFVAAHAGPVMGEVTLDEIREVDVSNEHDPIVRNMEWGRYPSYKMADVKNFLSQLRRDNDYFIVAHSPKRDGRWNWHIEDKHYIIFAAHDRVGYASFQDGQMNLVEATDSSEDFVSVSSEAAEETGNERISQGIQHESPEIKDGLSQFKSGTEVVMREQDGREIRFVLSQDIRVGTPLAPFLSELGTTMSYGFIKNITIISSTQIKLILDRYSMGQRIQDTVFLSLDQAPEELSAQGVRDSVEEVTVEIRGKEETIQFIGHDIKLELGRAATLYIRKEGDDFWIEDENGAKRLVINKISDTLGRSTDKDIFPELSNLQVSRTHITITRNGDFFTFKDISSNGTRITYKRAVDHSQTTDKLGGIDLNPNALDLQTQGIGIDFNISVDLEELKTMDFHGFTPVILQIIPTNLNLLLGLSDSLESESLSQAVSLTGDRVL